MKKQSFLLLLVCVSFLVSCSPTYKINSSDLNSHFLNRGASVLVLTSEDGSYGSDIYKGSGLTLARKVQSMLAQYQCESQIDLENTKFKDLEGKDLSKYDYIIVPVITHWEDRATAWSDMPDKLSYSLFIYNNDGSMLTSVDIDAQSASLTMTSNDPSDLIEPSLQQYFSKAF